MPEKILHPQAADEYWFQEGCYILETANHPDDPELSIVRVRVEPGTRTRWHKLEQTSERYLIIEGEGRIDAGALVQKTVTPGDIVYIPAGTAQRIANTGQQDLVFYAICLPRFTPRCYRDLEEDHRD